MGEDYLYGDANVFYQVDEEDHEINGNQRKYINEPSEYADAGLCRTSSNFASDPDSEVFEDYTAPLATYANGWQKYLDPSSGCHYYFHPESQKSSWCLPNDHDLPSAIPDIVQILEAEDGTPSDTPIPREMKGYLNCLKSGKIKLVKPVKVERWTRMYLFLSDGMLSFFKDEKAMEPTSSREKIRLPESSLFLQQAIIQLNEKVKGSTSTQDEIQIFGIDGTQYLLTHEDHSVLIEWFEFLKYNVRALEEKKRALLRTDMMSTSEYKALRASPSLMRMKNRWNSTAADMSGIKDKLMKFLKRRPSRNELQLRGIYKESATGIPEIKDKLATLLERRPSQMDLEIRGIYHESIFGSSLASVCLKDASTVPIFLMMCFKEIEKRGLAEDGIYRKSGSISQIQQLRIQVNQKNYDFSKEVEIHNLTGIVKLFFRELVEPLIPFSFLDRFIASNKHPFAQRRKLFAQLTQELPEMNRATLFALLQHFRKVIEHEKENRMSSNSLAIVFGPTLMWTEKNSNTEFSLGTMFVLQGQVVETLIDDFQDIFSNSSII